MNFRKIKNTIVKIIFLGAPHLLRRTQIPIILKHLQANSTDKLLDVGCGCGQITELIKGCKLIVGCEPGDGIWRFEINRKKVAVKGDGLKLPFKSGSFDRVLLSSVIQMIPQSQGLIIEAKRVLKNNGRLTVTTPIGYRYITCFFSKRGFRLIRKYLRLPDTYSKFKQELNKKFTITGQGYFEIEEVLNLFKRNNLKVTNWEYCPRGLATFIYEMLLILKYISGRNVSVGGMLPMLLYPIAWFDRYLPKHSVGCEIIVTGEKIVI